MASPKAAKSFPPTSISAPGGPNVALQALSEARDRDLQRQQITAQMQSDALKATVEGAKLKSAAAQDLSQGIVDASQAFATQEENQRQRDFKAGETKKAQDAQATREKAAQEAELTRTTAITDATKVNVDANRAAELAHNKATRDERLAQGRLQRLDVEIDSIMNQMASGEGFPADAEGAKAHMDRLKELAHAKNEQRATLGRGESRAVLDKMFQTAAVSSIARRQDAKSTERLTQQMVKSEANRQRDLAQKERLSTSQAPIFAKMHAEKLIDPGFAENTPPKEVARQVLLHLSQNDLSSQGEPGFGLVRALALNADAPPGQLNQVAAKLGPFGMAATDALVQTIQGFSTELGETDDPKLRAYRSAVVSELTFQGTKLLGLMSYSAIQYGRAADEYRVFYDQHRKAHGRPPTQQEQFNFIRGIKLDQYPGNLDLSVLYGIMGPPAPPAQPSAEALSAPAPEPVSGQSPTGRRIGLRGIGQKAVGAAQALVGRPEDRDQLQRPRTFRP